MVFPLDTPIWKDALTAYFNLALMYLLAGGLCVCLDKDNMISFEEFAKVLERTDVEQKMSIRFLS